MIIQESPLGFPIPKSFRAVSIIVQTARDIVLIIQVRIEVGGGGNAGTSSGLGVWPTTIVTNDKWKMSRMQVGLESLKP